MRVVAVSSVTAPTTSTTVITGLSLVPVIVTVMFWVLAALAIVESSVTVTT